MWDRPLDVLSQVGLFHGRLDPSGSDDTHQHRHLILVLGERLLNPGTHGQLAGVVARGTCRRGRLALCRLRRTRRTQSGRHLGEARFPPGKGRDHLANNAAIRD